ncbi:hypothetical protein CHUAL_013575 [Chamberlinius hualienensis]
MSLLEADIYNEQGAIDMPNVVQDIFRPPEFKQKYAYSGHLVIVIDAMVNWTRWKITDSPVSFSLIRRNLGV